MFLFIVYIVDVYVVLLGWWCIWLGFRDVWGGSGYFCGFFKNN